MDGSEVVDLERVISHEAVAGKVFPVRMAIIRGEDACDEYRNGENLALVAERLEMYRFQSAAEHRMFMFGFTAGRHSRSWTQINWDEAQRLANRHGVEPPLKFIA